VQDNSPDEPFGFAGTGRKSLGKLEEAVREQPEHPEQSCLFLEPDTQNVIAATAAQANLTALILADA
jgi:hypothetical protein